MPCPKKVQKEISKRKDRKKIKAENISSILSFIYWVKGLTNATSQDVAWCPKHQTAKWCGWFDGHCLKEKDNIVPFFKRKILFSFTHASSPFPLETSGSFFKFNSFLFIYLFIFFKFNFFINLFVPYNYGWFTYNKRRILFNNGH